VETIEVKRGTVAMLADHALTQVWEIDQHPDGDGCCPQCCAPCAALKQLLDAGLLDDLLRPRMQPCGSDERWDYTADRVDRAILARVWRMTSCHLG